MKEVYRLTTWFHNGSGLTPQGTQLYETLGAIIKPGASWTGADKDGLWWQTEFVPDRPRGFLVIRIITKEQVYSAAV